MVFVLSLIEFIGIKMLPESKHIVIPTPPREPHRGNSNMMRSLLFPPCTSYKHSMYHYAFGSICNSRSFSFISFAMHMSYNVVALYPDCRTYLLTWLFYEMCLNRCGYYNMLGFVYIFVLKFSVTSVNSKYLSIILQRVIFSNHSLSYVS
jgi:hypothetical protein